MSGIEFLQKRKEFADSLSDKTVMVIGGGNTAIDAARSARRDGAAVTILYRRSEAEMPAALHEVADARSEGVEFQFLVSPVEILRNEEAIQAVVLQVMQLGESDDEGRRRPVPIEGESRKLPADIVIAAVAQAPDWHGINAVAEDNKWLRTTANGRLDEGIFAGGDDRGPGLAARAIAQGRLAAESAHAELRGLPRPDPTIARKAMPGDAVRVDYYADKERVQLPRRPEKDWLSDSETEIDQTIGYEQAQQEANRCMSCGLCFDCQQCFMYCNGAGFTRIESTHPGSYFVLALDACEGCGKCIEVCPCGYLEARDE